MKSWSRSAKPKEVVIFGDDDFLRENTAPQRLVSLVKRGLANEGWGVTLSCDEFNPRRKHLSRMTRSAVRAFRLRPAKVCVYYGQSTTTLIALYLRQIGPKRLVSYLVEWPAAVPRSSKLADLNARLFCALVFHLSGRVIVISKYLEDVAKSANPNLPVIRIPILCDPMEAFNKSEPLNDPPILVFCADLDGYIDDARFVIAASSLLNRSFTLVLIGRASPKTLQSLTAFASSVGVSNKLRHLENVPRNELLAIYSSASALLLPLGDEIRSRARFPSKLADYLLSGSPVVATSVGEPNDLLSDDLNAFLAEDSTTESFARAILRCLDNSKSRLVGAQGASLAKTELSYLNHGLRLSSFLHEIHEPTPISHHLDQSGAGGGRNPLGMG